MILANQVAGHGSLDAKRAILKRPKDGKLLKPVQSPPKGEREINFYSQIFGPQSDKIDLSIRGHVPHYFGVEENAKHEKYLVLQDLTQGFEEPSILDVKIGSKTYGPGTPKAKQLKEDSKYLGTKGPLGFSIQGMQMYPLDRKEGVLKLDKSFGQNLKTFEVLSVPTIFFDTKNRFVPELIEIVVRQLKEVLKVFSNQRKYKIYASSVLIVYDSKAAKKFALKEIKSLEKFVVVKVIDFAHTFPANGERDENFIFGLKNLVSLFERCLKTKAN